MGNDTSRTPRSPLQPLVVAGVGLIAVMGFLYAVQSPSQEGYDETNRTITISTKPPASRDAHEMAKMSPASGGLMTHYDEGVWADAEFTVPEDLWFTEFSTEFKKTSVHNFYVFIKGSHDDWCPANPTAIYSGGTVSARQPTTFDAPYGVFVPKGTTLVLRSFYHEMADSSSDVSPSFTVHGRFELAASTTRTIPVSLHYITPGPCAYTRPVFTVPPHAKDAVYSTADTPFVFQDDGRILKAMAHFHAAYAKGVTNTVRLFLNGNTLDSFTTTDVGDDAERNPKLLTGRLVTVHRGDILTMHAIFNNPSDDPVGEGMAIVGFYFAPQTQ